MSLLMDEDNNMIPEEEYLDDPIQLIPQPDNLTSYPEPEEFTAYKQQSYVPVTFFNIERNIKLLNNCRPLCVKLVDCNQYPWYCQKLNKKYSHESNNLQTNDSDSSEDDNVMFTENESETLSMKAKSILSKISSYGLTIKLKTDKTKNKNKIKGIDFKKNKGLIGMKISPTFEVIEIDDDSEDLLIDNKNNEKETSSGVTAEDNEISSDIVTPDLTIDWTIENSKKHESKVNLTAGCNLVSQITEATKVITEVTHSDISHDSRAANDVEKAVYLNNYEQKATDVKTTGNTIVDSIKEGMMELKDKDNAMTKDGESEEKLIREVGCDLKEKTHETSTESSAKPTMIINNDNGKHFSIQSDTVITDSETLIEEDDCSKSPVFPCTPPKKIKKFTKDRHDKSKLVIHQPKDFTDNKFKPNRLSSPKAPKEVLAEKAKFIQDNTTECIKTTKPIPPLNSTIDVQAQNQKRLTSDEECVTNQNENDDIICNDVQQVNAGELNLEATSNPNKNDHEVTSKIGKVGKIIFQNLTSHNNLVSHESKQDKYCTDAPVSTSKSQTFNKEQIIKLKLDENIYKDVIEKQRSLQFNNRKETQRINVFDVTTKVSSQANKSARLIASKVVSLDQNYSEISPAHISDKQSSSSHTIDTILEKSKSENTSKLVSKKVHIFQKIGSAFLHEGTNNVIQGHADKRPQILSKSRIRPFTGSVSNWQNMTNELAKPNIYPKSMAPISKNRYLGNSQLNHQPHIITQNIVSTPAKKPQQSTGTAIDSNRYQIAQNYHKETSVLNDAVILARNVSNSSQNSTVSKNDGPRIVIQNIDPIAEQKRENVTQNGIARHNPQNCYIPSFGPQPRQFVRPIMRQDGTQVLSVSNYPRQMYSNTMNINCVPVNPYVGYSNNYNSYWPYQYTSMPPPPPPPPPNSKSVTQNISQAYGRVNASDNNKVNVIKQLHIPARPDPENLQNNNVIDRPNLIDINLNSTNSEKSLNSIVVNNSQNVVSSKTEMFEELEKEMMNIHHEDSENFINNQLCDRSLIDKHNNPKSDTRIKPVLNSTDITATQTLHTNKASKLLTKPARGHYDDTKTSRNTVLTLKRPSYELISKDKIKKMKNVTSTPKLDKNNAVVDESSDKGYSPPILPIPTYKETLDILTRASNDAQKRLEAFEKSRKQMSGNSNLKKDKVKKISLDEYKKRGDKRVCERKKRKYERKKKDETVKKCVEAKHSDQDQGYDSDSTVVL